MSVKDAGLVLGLSNKQVYRLIDRDEIESTRSGRKRLVVVESLRAYAERLLDASRESAAVPAA